MGELWLKQSYMNEFDLLTPTQKAWIIECWSCFPEFEHYAAARCADGLPDELLDLQEQAEDDEDFGYEPVKTEKLTQSNLDSVERYADRELDPADIEFSNHFFDRVNDTRNGKEISEPELTGFFKRLAKNKKKFLEFVKKYNESHKIIIKMNNDKTVKLTYNSSEMFIYDDLI